MQLSLQTSLCVPIHTRTRFPPKGHFTCFMIFHFFVESHFLQSSTSQGLVTGHWFSGQDSALSLPQPEFSLWLELRPPPPSACSQPKIASYHPSCLSCSSVDHRSPVCESLSTRACLPCLVLNPQCQKQSQHTVDTPSPFAARMNGT